jgi:hypothetical protein
VSAYGGERAGGLRLIRIVLVAISCGVVLNTTGVVVTFFFNADRVDQINEERAANIVRSCEDVNARNLAAVRELDRLLEQRSSNATPEQVERSRETTTALIDALVPRRDCGRLVRLQVGNP